ncbi:MAG: phosphoglycerate kinase [bacterium]
MTFTKKTIRDIPLEGKTILVRVDYNVPLGSDRILDDTRIQASIPTIRYLLNHQTKIILISHLGRPLKTDKKNVSLKLMAWRLARLLGHPVNFVPECIGKVVYEEINKMGFGEIALLENLRFHTEEEDNNLFFAKELASLADIFVLDAFGVAHRDHSSIVGIPKFLPTVTGFLMEKEITMLNQILNTPQKPFVLVVGGAKVKEKIGLLNNLMDKIDTLLIGGGMANTFLKCQGLQIGKSLVEEDKIDVASQLLQHAKDNNTKVILPIDVAVAKSVSPDAQREEKSVNDVAEDDIILDVGSKTIELFKQEIQNAKTVFWNGTLGMTELSAFEIGSKAIANTLAESDALRVVGGGDTAGALYKFGLSDAMTHVSTGGGASLKFLEGKNLVGIDVIEDK